ncbi:MAG: hypothetical protein WB780_00900 [Candidatus Acidiferrales bacterium]
MAVIFLTLELASLAVPAAKAPRRLNEFTLAGLSPGRDKIDQPEKEFRGLKQDDAAKDAYLWGDVCTHRDLRVEVDSHHLVRTVTVSAFYKPEIMAKCLESVMAPERLRLLKSGHGLTLGDACSRVAEIYGKPQSESPSVKGTDQLELYFYSFGWAGSDVPQVMEVSCSEGAGKVVEIMLAASSL